MFPVFRSAFGDLEKKKHFFSCSPHALACFIIAQSTVKTVSFVNCQTGD